MRLEELLPPPELVSYASGSYDEELFRATGCEFFNYFRDLCRLRPSARVLDLGCGCGRMAIPLVGHLDRTGSYEGIDIHSPSIEWATENIAANFPDFRFQRADVSNSTYNPQGKVPQHRYRLPFPDRSFDFAFMTSVFTHMLPSGLENYFREVVRVLRVGGRALMTFFLLNERSAKFIHARKSEFQFPFRWDICAVQSAEHPEHVVGYNEMAIKRMCRSYGMRLHGPIIPGRWTGNPDGMSFQDLVITQKTRIANWKLAIRRLAPPLAADRPQFVTDEAYMLKAA